MQRLQSKKRIACIILILISAIGFISDESLVSREDQRPHSWLKRIGRLALAFLGVSSLTISKKAHTMTKMTAFYYHPVLAFLRTIIIPRLHQSSYLSLH